MLAICSLWGAPGVTTTAYGFASVLSGDMGRTILLAECDESGGDLAIRLSMPATPGLATLAAVARRGLVVEKIWEHVQESPTGVGLLMGLSSAEQSGALSEIWSELARVLASVTEVAVVTDLGRLPPGIGAMDGFLRRATSVIVVTGSDAASLVHTSRRLPTLRALNPSVHLALVGSGPYGCRDVEEATGAEVIAVLDNGKRGCERDLARMAASVVEGGYLDRTGFDVEGQETEDLGRGIGALSASSEESSRPLAARHDPEPEACDARGTPVLKAVSIRDVRARAAAR